MASSTFGRTITAGILVACAVFGGYATFGASHKNGLLDALASSSGYQATKKYFLGGPTPYKTTYTGIELIDNHLAVLIGFFVILIDGPATWDVAVAYWLLMAEVCAAWLFIRLEGYRGGNSRHGRIVSWTGTFGVLMQNITIAITSPIYFLIHLLTSPTSGSNPTPEDLAVDPSDSTPLLHNAVLSFIVPAVLMSLPSPSFLPADAHYKCVAMWQVFPITDTVCHYIMKSFLPDANERLTAAGARALVTSAYRVILYMCFVPRTIAMAVALTPAALVPEELKAIFEQLTLKSLFVPSWPWDSPMAGDPGSPAGKPELAKLFLQWDVASAGTAILAWAVFVYLAALPGKSLLRDVVPKVLGYGVVGGPVAAATMLVMERDAAVFGRAGRDKKK
ncbi:hypothetical protein KVR01_003043 [Diaporthe batatas]|uniref:uncharacterized protein n=1 Tax=Diaporthe batatas TaxID=748121 RepID=UPI001D04C38C|nr:uncharacterized protein KVR01_003043 [Diaporthe batatas]KAG8167354.1 hypothetical protein KVR01_003043 [Diaporthe batatas]